jgi:hypothetical protein
MLDIQMLETAIAKRQGMKELQQVPGIGPRIADDLWVMGYHKVTDLKDQDPEALYRRLCAHQGAIVDRCMLYVFRCAVYFASNARHDPALLKWWNWKD